MAKGVAEIEDCTIPLFPFIFVDDHRLVLTRTMNSKCQRVIVALEQVVQINVYPFQKFPVSNQPVLNYLSKPCAQFAIGERCKRSGIGEYGARLVEGADHIFTKRVIHRGLSADRGIDLG